MVHKKYTLPRHTNLANQGPRIGAFLIDLAIAFALALGLFFGCFQFVFKFKTAPLEKKIVNERISSHLFYKDENGKLDYYKSDSDNEEFKDALAYFYLVYVPSTYEEEKDKFTVSWFNETVLDVEGGGAEYFTYVKVGEVDDKNQVAVFKDEAIENEALKKSANNYLQTAWITANYNLNHIPSFRKLNNEYSFFVSLGFVISSLISTTLTYVVIPIILKGGKTVGKKVFGLGLADGDGYVLRNPQLLMRVMPIDVLILALLIPIWNSMLTIFIVVLVIFLISFTLVMASPKKSALHDFTARTIVIDAKTSILFSNAADEELYIAKEDNIESEVIEREEPSLRYEK